MITENITDIGGHMNKQMLSSDYRNHNGGCLVKIRGTYPSLTSLGQKVADFFLQNAPQVIHYSIVDLADVIGVSVGTVGQFCRNVGFRRFSDFKVALAQDVVSHHLDVCESISMDDDFPTITDKIFSINTRLINDTRKIIDIKDLITAATWLANANRIHFYGIGGSAAVALDCQCYFAHFGVVTQAFSDVAMQIVSATMLTENDIAVGISQSGRSKVIVNALSVAKESGAKTISLTNYRKSPITEVSDICFYTSFNAEERGLKTASLSSRVAQMTIMETLYVMVAKMKHKEGSGIIDKINKNIENKVRE